MLVDKELDVVLVETGNCVECGVRLSPKNISAVCPKCDVKLRPPVSEQEAVHELARQEIAMRELCRRRFLPFVQRLNPEYHAGWFHQDLAARIERFVRRVEREESPRMIINVPPRRGKECADFTPVFTPAGWTTHGALRAGDYVFHPSGKPVKVLEVHPPGLDTMEVELTNGEVIQCHENHEWTVFDRAHKKWMTVETRWFVERSTRGTKAGQPRALWSGPRASRGGRARYQLPTVAALELPTQEYALDPYVLGAWLGDGTTAAPAISHHADDTAVVYALVANGYAVSSTQVHTKTGVHTTRFGGRRGTAGPFTTALRSVGVWGDKHIPEQYKLGAVEQRLDLLAGLIDTDGHVDKTGRVTFANANERLIHDVCDVVRSMGWRASVHVRAPTVSTSGVAGRQTVYEVSFSPDRLLPLRINRKYNRQKPVRQRRIGIKDVRRAVKPAIGRCITVDSPDGLYLVGRRMVPTHNSEQASKALPAWFLGRNPNKAIIATTHSDDLAFDNSRDVLRYIKDEKYQSVFPGVRLNKDNQGATGWRTTEGGVYKPAGVGKGIAGRGAHIFLIDDPHKDKEAYSETVRNAIWRWYKSSARTRLMPGGGIIIIQTRWVLDDLTGRVLDEEGKIEDGGIWEHIVYPEEAIQDEYRLPSGIIVNYPAPRATLLRKKGEVLHPERYSAESNIEHKRDPVTWAALFQQDPTAEGAGTVTEELLEKCACVMSDVPQRLVHYNTWDTAVSQNEGSCRSASIVGGLDTNGVLWIVDARQDRMDGLALADEIISVYRQFKPEVTGIEKTNHAVAMRPFLDRYIEDQRIYGLTITDLEHGNKDKVARARPMQAMMRLGKVRIPTDAPWYEDLKAELLRFPATPNDLADAFFYQGQLLADMAEPHKPKSEPKKSWKDKVGARKRKTKNWRTG